MGSNLARRFQFWLNGSQSAIAVCQCGLFFILSIHFFFFFVVHLGLWQTLNCTDLSVTIHLEDKYLLYCYWKSSAGPVFMAIKIQSSFDSLEFYSSDRVNLMLTSFWTYFQSNTRYGLKHVNQGHVQIWLLYSDFYVLVIRPTLVHRSSDMTLSRWWSWLPNGSTQPYPVCPMCATFKNSYLDTYAHDKSRTRRLDHAEDALSQLSQIFKYCFWQSPRCHCLWRASSALHNYSLKLQLFYLSSS